MLALKSAEKGDVLWLNCDVCLDKEVVSRVLQKGGNTVGVNSEECGVRRSNNTEPIRMEKLLRYQNR